MTTVATNPASGTNLKTSNGEATQAKTRRGLQLVLATLLGALTLAYGGVYVREMLRSESTDDAQVDGDITHVGARVAGTLKTVHVVSTQEVRAGQELAELDTSDLEIERTRASADVARAAAELEVDRAAVSIRETENTAGLTSSAAEVRALEAMVAGARGDLLRLQAQLSLREAHDRHASVERGRAERLFRVGAIAAAELETRVTTSEAYGAELEAQRQTLAAARHALAQTRARLAMAESTYTQVKANAPKELEIREAHVKSKQGILEQARAVLARVELDLARTKITAPASGVVGKRAVNGGERVAVGQQLFAIAQTAGLWVTANYRETQTRRMRAGHPVELYVDSTGDVLRGCIASLGGATGSRLSLFPPENAAGNYVKVVQRIPVRIGILPGQRGVERLRIGMSVDAKVLLEESDPRCGSAAALAVLKGSATQ